MKYPYFPLAVKPSASTSMSINFYKLKLNLYKRELKIKYLGHLLSCHPP